MTYSFDDLLPHIRPLAPLLDDPDVTEIMVNEGGRVIFTQRGGRLYLEPITLKAEALRTAIEVIARMVEQEPDDAHPLLNARLADGSRVSATLAAQSPDGDVMTIRRFGRRYTLDELVAVGGLTPATADLLRQAVLDQKNILFAGGTGSGKTTMVNAVADTIPAEERLLLLESTSEIYLDIARHPNRVRFEARVGQDRPDMQWPAIAISELLQHALRFTPDRIIVGEVRGVEAWDLLQALNTGHQGSMSTIHANSAVEALIRLADCVIGPGGIAMPHRALRDTIARSIDLVVQIVHNRQTGQRRVAHVINVDGYDASTDQFLTSTLYPAPEPLLQEPVPCVFRLVDRP